MSPELKENPFTKIFYCNIVGFKVREKIPSISYSEGIKQFASSNGKYTKIVLQCFEDELTIPEAADKLIKIIQDEEVQD